MRTPNRPVTPLPEPIIDRDFLDRDYDTLYQRTQKLTEDLEVSDSASNVNQFLNLNFASMASTRCDATVTPSS